ncbi:MAG: hypothetical protein P4M12_09100 [Gammaproteobacteria bacterium]|nr:hypothetical protein [Gammaproteobacteria bacterium]
MINRYIITLLCLCLFSTLCKADLRDPTRPEATVSVESVTKFELSAILTSPTSKAAVINGRIVHVGDYFSTVQVISIETNKVELMGPDGKITLVLLTTPKRPLLGEHK